MPMAAADKRFNPGGMKRTTAPLQADSQEYLPRADVRPTTDSITSRPLAMNTDTAKKIPDTVPTSGRRDPLVGAISEPFKHSIFISAELFTTRGLSLVYSRRLAFSHLGLGPGIEFIDFQTKKLGGIMPFVDVRYFLETGRSTFMPLAQAGYNFLNLPYTKINSTTSYIEKGGPSFSLGLGYSYATRPKGSGPYAAIRYRSLQYRYNDPTLPKTITGHEMTIAVGWRF
jgi:hypothetical protein